ncbi:MAG: OB-fold domain-containing protein [Thermoplasmata archaeon]|nr:OB-fold domain-containing protein [Thermoplasmata archaeon]
MPAVAVAKRRAKKRAPKRAEAALPKIELRAEPTAPPPKKPATLTLLDFFPQEESQQTRVARFFTELRAGRFMTTRCAKDKKLLWPPRVTCPQCHTEELEWVELPQRGHLYAFSALLAGAPLGMEDELPITVGLVDLEGAPLRLFGRLVGAPWNEIRVGERVRVEPYDLPDGRVFYRFHVESRSVEKPT